MSLQQEETRVTLCGIIASDKSFIFFFSTKKFLHEIICCVYSSEVHCQRVSNGYLFGMVISLWVKCFYKQVINIFLVSLQKHVGTHWLHNFTEKKKRKKKKNFLLPLLSSTIYGDTSF